MSAEDDRLRIRLAEIMSSAGLGYNQISLEILYLIPREFVDQYIALWEKALGAAGSGDKAGQQLHRDAQLGKHKTETAAKGKKIGAGSGGQGKRYKKFFVIRDEEALELKGRIDRRLRNMAREMADSGRGKKGGEKVLTQCKSCGKIMSEGFRFCPFDGSPIEQQKGLKENEK
jgi:hypothetical protein